ncbi:MAG: uncharacterized SAM-binding protein YcdF (DUF218 family) [Methylophagaceae bacterium]|jgi:uncharacterized SAM-binding protein YcdF (DUF218 family)
MLVITLYTLGDSVIYPIESRFKKALTMPESIAGIFVLGGGEQLKTSFSWETYELGAGGDWYSGAALLAKRYPTASVIFTGENNLLIFQEKAGEDSIARSLLPSVCIDVALLIIESNSRNIVVNSILINTLITQRVG